MDRSDYLITAVTVVGSERGLESDPPSKQTFLTHEDGFAVKLLEYLRFHSPDFEVSVHFELAADLILNEQKTIGKIAAGVEDAHRILSEIRYTIPVLTRAKDKLSIALFGAGQENWAYMIRHQYGLQANRHTGLGLL